MERHADLLELAASRIAQLRKDAEAEPELLANLCASLQEEYAAWQQKQPQGDGCGQDAEEEPEPCAILRRAAAVASELRTLRLQLAESGAQAAMAAASGRDAEAQEHASRSRQLMVEYEMLTAAKDHLVQVGEACVILTAPIMNALSLLC